MSKDISDLYIKGTRDKFYDSIKVENTTFIDTIISKIYMILMTNKGDVMGDPNFGADIPKFLWKTKFPSSTIKNNIEDQFSNYIPELKSTDYKINVYILQGKIQDIGIISINLGITALNILFK